MKILRERAQNSAAHGKLSALLISVLLLSLLHYSPVNQAMLLVINIQLAHTSYLTKMLFHSVSKSENSRYIFRNEIYSEV